MTRERVGQDSVIVQRAENRDSRTPEEKLAAETNRIVDETWGLYLDVAQHEPNADMPGLLALNIFDEEDRECMAELVEEAVSETIYAWVDNKHLQPPADKLTLVTAFLGIGTAEPVRGDLPFSDYCLLQYVAYTEEQSQLALAAAEEFTPDGTAQSDTTGWSDEPEPDDDLPVPAPKPRTLH